MIASQRAQEHISTAPGEGEQSWSCTSVRNILLTSCGLRDAPVASFLQEASEPRGGRACRKVRQHWVPAALEAQAFRVQAKFLHPFKWLREFPFVMSAPLKDHFQLLNSRSVPSFSLADRRQENPTEPSTLV